MQGLPSMTEILVGGQLVAAFVPYANGARALAWIIASIVKYLQDKNEFVL